MPRLTPIQWIICAIAALGFAFDSYELLMLPLIVRPALSELLGVPPTSPLVNEWVGYLLYIPAVAGGIFGLLGGYLTDLLGRRRVLVWSILLYAFSAFAAGYSSTVGWLLFWRCCTFVGVCVEFVAAVAWLAELFADTKRRESIIGYTQAFGSIGGVMVTAAYYLIVTYGESLPAVRGAHEAWRYTLMSGVVPRSADRHQAVPSGITSVAREEIAGVEARASALFDVGSGARRRDDGDDGVRVRRRSARFSRCRDRAGPCRGSGPAAPGSQQRCRVQSFQEIRRPARSNTSRVVAVRIVAGGVTSVVSDSGLICCRSCF